MRSKNLRGKTENKNKESKSKEKNQENGQLNSIEITKRMNKLIQTKIAITKQMTVHKIYN